MCHLTVQLRVLVTALEDLCRNKRATLTKAEFKPSAPNDHYSGRTAPLTSKLCILNIYSTNIGTEYFKHGI